jgi:hypothetical protein
MSKKKRRRRRTPPLTAKDRHHILYQARYWNNGYAKALRNAFVRPVPVLWHRELHQLLTNVPMPDGSLIRQAWVEYQAEKDVIDSMGVCQAIAWLYVHIPDVEFRRAMQFQIDFFATKYELGLGAR